MTPAQRRIALLTGVTMNLPKISRLDLRSLEVQVAEHNAQPEALKLRVWYQKEFERYRG